MEDGPNAKSGIMSQSKCKLKGCCRACVKLHVPQKMTRAKMPAIKAMTVYPDQQLHNPSWEGAARFVLHAEELEVKATFGRQVVAHRRPNAKLRIMRQSKHKLKGCCRACLKLHAPQKMTRAKMPAIKAMAAHPDQQQHNSSSEGAARFVSHVEEMEVKLDCCKGRITLLAEAEAMSSFFPLGLFLSCTSNHKNLN